jgi:hypothetical protein
MLETEHCHDVGSVAWQRNAHTLQYQQDVHYSGIKYFKKLQIDINSFWNIQKKI